MGIWSDVYYFKNVLFHAIYPLKRRMNNLTVESMESKNAVKVQARISQHFEVVNTNISETLRCPMLLTYEGTCIQVIIEFRLFGKKMYDRREDTQ
jgi:hypothetical protein